MQVRITRTLAVLAAVTGVAVAAGLVPATSAAAGGASEEARAVPLRIVSFNMHTGIGSDGRLDLARTAAMLESIDADVIGLQEVDVHWAARSEWRDQASDLAEALDVRAFFAPIYSLDPPTADAPRREFGLAVLTDLPVIEATNHDITRLSTQDADPAPAPAPGFPEVVVVADGAPVHVYNTHLDYRADPTVRSLQVQDMLRVLAEDRAGAQQVLVGDLNAPPDAPELSPLWDRVADTWEVAGAGDGLTYPAVEPTKRIDYVTVSPNVRVEAVDVVDTDVSDHRPVVADLVVRRGAWGT